MLSPDGRVVMIYNGEIFNYRELRAALEARGETFVGASDSEVMLRWFSIEGPQSFARFNGMFAAAFWERDTRTLTLVRDPIGVKPLYYTAGQGRLAFASELKALLAAGDVAPAINAAAVLHHLGYLWSPGEETVVAGIRKLLPGHVLQFAAGAAEPRIWCFSDPARPPEAREAISVDDAAAQVREAVEAAVRRQLITDVPLGAFLSGGLDSSAVVAFASKHFTGPGKLQCFSIEIEGGAGSADGVVDDLPYAKRVAEHLDVDLQVVRAGGEMMQRLGEMLYHLDEPTPDPAALNSLLISELARQSGIKVLLSGAGGDDIFTGYRRHFALTQEKWWSGLPLPARSLLQKGSAALPSNRPLSRRIAKAFRYASLPEDQRLASYFFWLDPERALGLLAPDLRSGLSQQTMFAPLLSTLANLPSGLQPLDRMLYLECKHFLADHNLNYGDKMGMAASVEVRVPLLDLELVRLANRLPLSLRQHGGVGKWIFKRAMEPILPRDVIYRPKSGFGVPLRSWLRGPMREVIADALSPTRVRDRGLFDPVGVQRLVEDDLADRVDGAYTLFSLTCLELWCRQFIDAPTATAEMPLSPKISLRA